MNVYMTNELGLVTIPDRDMNIDDHEAGEHSDAIVMDCEICFTEWQEITGANTH
jgi:hypothetical protein